MKKIALSFALMCGCSSQQESDPPLSTGLYGLGDQLGIETFLLLEMSQFE